MGKLHNFKESLQGEASFKQLLL